MEKTVKTDVETRKSEDRQNVIQYYWNRLKEKKGEKK